MILQKYSQPIVSETQRYHYIQASCSENNLLWFKETLEVVREAPSNIIVKKHQDISKDALVLLDRPHFLTRLTNNTDEVIIMRDLSLVCMTQEFQYFYTHI